MARYDIARFRREHKITQKEFANKLGISQGFLSSVENGRNPFPSERVEDLEKNYPDINWEDYELTEEDVKQTNIGSNNDNSDVRINDDATIKMLLQYLTKANGAISIAHQEEDTEAKEWRQRFDKAFSDYEKEKTEKEKYMKMYYDLLVEFTKAKELLIRNNIEFEK